MSETNTKVNDDLQYSITNTNSNMNTQSSRRPMLSKLRKELPLQSMKSFHFRLPTQRHYSKPLVSSKNVIPPLIENFNKGKQLFGKRPQSLKLSTSSKSRNEPLSIYQTLSPLSHTQCIHHTQPATTTNNQNNNEINFKDRRLIRQATKRFKSLTSRDQDDIESLNQLTQFKTNDIGGTFNTLANNNDAYPSSLSRKMHPLTEPNIIYSDRTTRSNHHKRELKKLIKTNPYHSLKNNFKYSLNQNQLAYAKDSQKTHRLLNYTKSKDKNVIYKVNHCSTLFIKQEKKVKGSLTKRLIARKNDLPADLKSIIFWQGVKWLWMNYSVQIKQLLFSFINLKWYLDKEVLLSQNAINELFSLIQLNKANNFSEALFLVFNENKSLYINMKIVINVLIATKKCSYKEKIKETMNVWATGAEDGVRLTDLVELAQLLFQHKSDVKKVIELSKQLLNIRDLSGVVVNKNVLCNMCSKEKQLKFLIKRNRIDLILYEQMFESEIMNMYNINIRNSKGLIEVNDAQRQCELEIMKYEKILSIVVECNLNRNDLKERVLNEQAEP